MDHFRRLITTALLAGLLAGLVLFVVQHFTIVPLIELAEGFEGSAPVVQPLAGQPAPATHVPGGQASAVAGPGSKSDPAAHAHFHDDEGWQPSPGFQRIGLTAVTTVISGIGFAAILLAGMTLRGAAVDLRRGVLWGLAGFACFVLAPALGLPPKPPSAAVGDLHWRQMWWAGTVLATACGLWLIFGPHANRWSRMLGVVVLGFPHALGVPPPEGIDLAPATLMRDFAVLSIGTNLLFWLVLGGACGWLLSHGWGRMNGPQRPGQA